MPPPTPRRRAAWLAVVLNLLLPPIGYAYLGRLRWALVFTAFGLALAVAVAVWSIRNPPGMFGALEGLGPLQLFGVALNLGAAVHAAVLARAPRPRRRLPLLIGAGAALWLLPLVLGFAARAAAPIATYATASDSMSPTLEVGDIVLSNGARAFCGRKHVAAGDVVFFVTDGVTVASRAVAGPGQTVAMQSGRLVIDGRPVATTSQGRRSGGSGPVEIIRETLSNGRSYLTTDMGPSALDETSTITVPAGHWFTLGDNRDNALDSRVRGPVAAATVCGVGIRVLNSADADRVGSRP